MSKVNLGLLLASVGAIGVAIAGIKFFVVGFYADEFILYAAIGIIGAALCWSGSKIYQTGKQEG